VGHDFGPVVRRAAGLARGLLEERTDRV